MPVYTTRKTTVKGKSATLAIRQARVRKYAPAATLTRSAHAKVVK
jgi:hypothetical protein